MGIRIKRIQFYEIGLRGHYIPNFVSILKKETIQTMDMTFTELHFIDMKSTELHFMDMKFTELYFV